MTDIFKTYSEMEQEDIILAFKGDVTQELLSSVYSIVESRLENDHEALRKKKKFYQVVVECLQNVYHHMEQPESSASKPAIFLIARGKDNSLHIMTGNFISIAKRDSLTTQIEKMNTMTGEELRAYHLDKLSSTQLSEKGGAGLGIIEIARKSGNKLDYRFDTISEQHAFFSLSVTVN
ncbi:MAG: SiaB family protein kinase [Chitinophagales bacterium]|nr:SiaB family protein kinase [Chitinophagales bacterium]